MKYTAPLLLLVISAYVEAAEVYRVNPCDAPNSSNCLAGIEGYEDNGAIYDIDFRYGSFNYVYSHGFNDQFFYCDPKASQDCIETGAAATRLWNSIRGWEYRLGLSETLSTQNYVDLDSGVVGTFALPVSTWDPCENIPGGTACVAAYNPYTIETFEFDRPARWENGPDAAYVWTVATRTSPEPTMVPELDPSGSALALCLLAGLIALVRECQRPTAGAGATPEPRA